MQQEPIETTVARLEERFLAVQTVIQQLAEDQRKLVASYEKLVESNQRILLVESEISSLKSCTEKMQIRFEGMSNHANGFTRHALYDLLKYAFALAMGAILMKGGKL